MYTKLMKTDRYDRNWVERSYDERKNTTMIPTLRVQVTAATSVETQTRGWCLLKYGHLLLLLELRQVNTTVPPLDENKVVFL